MWFSGYVLQTEEISRFQQAKLHRHAINQQHIHIEDRKLGKLCQTASAAKYNITGNFIIFRNR